YHGAGLRSTINSDLVTSVELVPGAYGADYGRGLGGLVRVETRPLPKEGVHGYVGADTLDASAMVAAKLTDRLRVGAATRYSYLDSVLSAVSAPDVGDYFPIPRYRDYQVKATLDLGRNESIDAVFLGSNEDLRRAIPSPDPARIRAETSESSFQRAYLRYVRVASNGDTINVTPFAGYDHSNVTTAFGEVPTQLDIGSWKYGLRASHRSKVARAIDLTLGVDALGASSDIRRAGTLTLPPREGDVTVFGQAPGSDYNVDRWSTNIVDLGPYVLADIRVGKFTFTPGLRFDAYLIEGSRMTPRVGLTPAIGFSRLSGVVDPRLTVRYQASPRLLFTASAGTYHQGPEPEDLSAVFGTPDLALSHATHVSLGQALKITSGLTAEMIGFYKYLGDLPVRTRLPEPKLARALTQDGEGRSYGVQLLVRQEVWRGLFGWISYTISRSERRYVLEERYRLFDFDQPHVLAAVLSQEIGRWVFGARFRYTSGSPRTPVVGSFYDARGDQSQPVFGEQNTARITDFYQLDLRAERTFPLGKRVTLALFLDVLNVTFHKNN
ncbi:MAG: TonB-dependent receptor, partial [Polyangiaceae bacterium]